MKPATGKACAECPWRKQNHGKRHPHGWYTKKNLRRLWAGLRTGEAPAMSCHPTDPRNEVPEGCTPVPEGTEPVECSGALLLIQRELRKFQSCPAEYDHRRGISRRGMLFWGMARAVLAGTLLGDRPMPEIPEDKNVQRQST